MDSLSISELHRKTAGVCLIAAPLLMSAGDMLARSNQTFSAVIVYKLSLLFFVFSAFALASLLQKRAEAVGLLGAGLVIVGCLAINDAVTTETIRETFKKTALDSTAIQTVREVLSRVEQMTLPVLGLSFPLGHLILAMGFFGTRVVSLFPAGFLALGAVLFPAGRLFDLPAANLISDAAFVIALGLIGWQFFRVEKDSPDQIHPPPEDIDAD